MKRNFLLVLCLFSLQLFSQNKAPEITSVTFVQQGKTVDFDFTLSDEENDLCTVEVHVFKKTGTNLQTVSTVTVSGDTGTNIEPGNKKLSVTLPSDGDYKINIVAFDENTYDLQAIVDRVDTSHLLSDLYWLEGIRHRTAGAAKLAEVQDSIGNLFGGLGFETKIHTFNFQSYPLKNYIGNHYGAVSPDRVLINDAHYDCVPFGPGADDNATGVAGFMEIARILADYKFEKTVRFIGFDVEEDGLIGSNAYINKGGLSSADTIEGVLNFEMIGYYTDKVNSQTLPFGFDILFPDQAASIVADQYRGNFITNVSNQASKGISTAFQEAAALYVPELKVISLEVPGKGELTPDLRRSDHASFWDAGKPALMLTDGANFRNKNYHTANDRVDSLNMKFMGNVVKAALGTLLEQAKIIHGDVSSSEVQLTTSTREPAGVIFEVFPNPVKDKLHLTIMSSDNFTLTVLNVAGEAVFSRNYKAQQGEGLDIDSSAWPAGSYLLNYESRDGRISRKIVKN